MNIKLLFILLWANISYCQISESTYNYSDSLINTQSYNATHITINIDTIVGILYWDCVNSFQESEYHYKYVILDIKPIFESDSSVSTSYLVKNTDDFSYDRYVINEEMTTYKFYGIDSGEEGIMYYYLFGSGISIFYKNDH